MGNLGHHMYRGAPFGPPTGERGQNAQVAPKVHIQNYRKSGFSGVRNNALDLREIGPTRFRGVRNPGMQIVHFTLSGQAHLGPPSGPHFGPSHHMAPFKGAYCGGPKQGEPGPRFRGPFLDPVFGDPRNHPFWVPTHMHSFTPSS